MNHCIKSYIIFYRAFIIVLIVSLYIWTLSRVFIIFPFPVICKISIPSIDQMESLLSKRYCGNLDFPFPYLKSRKCSWNLTWTDLPVCPIYFLLQLWHVNWQMPHLLNFFWLMFLFWVNNFPTVFLVLKDTLKLVFLNNLVINLVCLPTYVNFAHLVCVFPSLCFCPSFIWLTLFKIAVSYLFYIVSALLCHFPFFIQFHS